MHRTIKPRVSEHRCLAAALVIARLCRRPILWAAEAADVMLGHEREAVETAGLQDGTLAVINLVFAARMRAARRVDDPVLQQRAVCAARIEAAALFREADLPMPSYEPDTRPRCKCRAVYPEPPQPIAATDE